jgi:hypothetical protein
MGKLAGADVSRQPGRATGLGRRGNVGCDTSRRTAYLSVLDSDAVMRAPHRGGRLRPRLEARRWPDRVSASRLREMITEFKELWAEQPDVQDPRERPHAEDARRRLAEAEPRASVLHLSAGEGHRRMPAHRLACPPHARTPSLPSHHPGPACSSGCGRPRHRPTNCDAS